jgi:hypothetical protein
MDWFDLDDVENTRVQVSLDRTPGEGPRAGRALPGTTAMAWSRASARRSRVHRFVLARTRLVFCHNPVVSVEPAEFVSARLPLLCRRGTRRRRWLRASRA